MPRNPERWPAASVTIDTTTSVQMIEPSFRRRMTCEFQCRGVRSASVLPASTKLDAVGHDERGDVLAQGLLGRIAEQMLGALVPERHLVGQVGADDRLAHAVQQHRLHAQSCPRP